MLLVQTARLQIAQDAPNQIRAAQQFRRNCGVRFRSERTIVPV